MDSSISTPRTGTLPIQVCKFFLLLPCFVEISETDVNSVDLDQTPRSVALNLVYTIFQGPLRGTLDINWPHYAKCVSRSMRTARAQISYFNH